MKKIYIVALTLVFMLIIGYLFIQKYTLFDAQENTIETTLDIGTIPLSTSGSDSEKFSSDLSAIVEEAFETTKK